jgi:hypothetical protein
MIELTYFGGTLLLAIACAAWLAVWWTERGKK